MAKNSASDNGSDFAAKWLPNRARAMRLSFKRKKPQGGILRFLRREANADQGLCLMKHSKDAA